MKLVLSLFDIINLEMKILISLQLCIFDKIKNTAILLKNI